MNQIKLTIIGLTIFFFLYCGSLCAQDDQPIVVETGEKPAVPTATNDTADDTKTKTAPIEPAGKNGVAPANYGEGMDDSEKKIIENTEMPVEKPERSPIPESAKKSTANASLSPKKSDTETTEHGGANSNNRTYTGLYSFRDALKKAREARCKTAICFGNDNVFAFEPLIDIPVGLTFAVGNENNRGYWNDDPLAAYINNHDFSVQFVAGLRFWFAYDLFSFSVYFSKPILDNDEIIHVQGCPASIKNPVNDN